MSVDSQRALRVELDRLPVLCSECNVPVHQKDATVVEEAGTPVALFTHHGTAVLRTVPLPFIQGLLRPYIAEFRVPSAFSIRR